MRVDTSIELSRWPKDLDSMESEALQTLAYMLPRTTCLPANVEPFAALLVGYTNLELQRRAQRMADLLTDAHSTSVLLDNLYMSLPDHLRW